jgi:hypothetical protein
VHVVVVVVHSVAEPATVTWYVTSGSSEIDAVQLRVRARSDSTAVKLVGALGAAAVVVRMTAVAPQNITST